MNILGANNNQHETLAKEEDLGSVAQGTSISLTCPRGTGLTAKATGLGSSGSVSWTIGYAGTGADDATLSPLTTLTPNSGSFSGGGSDNTCVAMVITTASLGAGTYHGELQLTGAGANSQVYYFRFTVTCTGPTIICPADTTVQCFSAVPVANFAGGSTSGGCGVVTVTHVGDSQSNPGSSCNNVITRTYKATDAAGNFITGTQTITVQDTAAPAITTLAGALDKTLECSDAAGLTAALALVPTASDNCTAAPTIHLVSDVTTPDANCANASVRVRTWNFSDGCGNTSLNFVQTITVQDTAAPAITTLAGALDKTLECSDAAGLTAALALVPTASDNCTAAPTIHLVSDVTTPDANCANASVRVRTWNFSDGCGNTSLNFVQTITVQDTAAPAITTLAGALDKTLECSDAAGLTAALALVPTASDNCTAAPTIHLVSDVTTPDANCANASVRVRTWNFSDGCGNTSLNFVQTITVQDTAAPAITTLAGALDKTLECSDAAGLTAALALVPTASDNCTAAPTIHLVSDVTTPDANCANASVRVRTWNFSDGCGNTSLNFVQTITVQDTAAPAITTLAGALDKTLECSDAAGLTAALALVPTASDNCTAAPTIHLVSDVTTPDANCANASVRVRTWNFSDGCGNTSLNFVQTITVQDTAAPAITTLAGALDKTLECSDAAGLTAALALVPTASDNCTANPTIHLVSDVTTPDANCANASVRVRTWNFSDGCGNTSLNFVQTITVQDTAAPAITTLAGALDKTLECSDAAGLTAALALVPTASDNCTANPTIHLVSDVTTADATCPNGYVQVRTWNFSDGCGNTSLNFVQTITVKDTTAPVITCPADITVGCSVDALVSVPFSASASDNCSASADIVIKYYLGYVDSTHKGTEITSPYGFPIGSTIVTAEATDACGNSSTCPFTVTRAALGFTGFLPPIGGADATGGDFAHPVRSFKLGSTIPVKFSANCGGGPVLTGVHTLQAIKYSSSTSSDAPIDATPTDAATTGNEFRLTDSEWHFNLSTKSGFTKGIWKLVATLSDGSQHVVWLETKK